MIYDADIILDTVRFICILVAAGVLLRLLY